MKYDLAALIRRNKNPRRSQIVFRPIQPTATMAGDLYAAAYKPLITLLTAAIDPIVASYAVLWSKRTKAITKVSAQTDQRIADGDALPVLLQ